MGMLLYIFFFLILNFFIEIILMSFISNAVVVMILSSTLMALAFTIFNRRRDGWVNFMTRFLSLATIFLLFDFLINWIL